MKKEGKKMKLVDNRGIGKPEKFNGKESESHLRWKIKTETEQALTRAEEQGDAVADAYRPGRFRCRLGKCGG